MNEDLEKLKTELAIKDAQLKVAGEREKELEEVRRAMLYMLEDLNRSSEAVARSQKEWLRTVDAFPDPLFVHDSDYKIVRANKAYAEAAGLPFREFIGKRYFEVFPKMKGPFNKCIEAIVDKKEGEEIFRFPSGRFYRIRFFPFGKEGDAFRYSTHIMEDVTESRKVEERKKIIDVFNQRMILNVDTENGYHELCKAITEFDYKMAWVGELNNDTKEVIPMASAGFEEDYLSTIKVKFDDSPLGEGPTGRAIKNRLPEIQNQINTDPKYEPWREAAQMRGYGSSAAFPMITGDKVIGVLNVYNGGDLFPEAEVDFLQDFADRAATYIGNALLFRKLEESGNRIRQEMAITGDLLMIAEAISGKTDMDKLMEEVAACCQRLMGSDICLSYIFDQDANVFSPSRAVGLSREELPLFRTNHLGKDVWFVKEAIVMKRACPISAPLERRGLEGEYSTSDALKWIEGLSEALVIPLVGRTGPMGMILAIYRNKKVFTDRDYNIANGMSRQVTTALEEARLYRDSVNKSLDLSHKIETIRIMHEIDKSILSVLNRDELLETAVNLVGKVVPCDRSIAFLVDSEKEGFIYIAGGDEEASTMEYIPFADTIASMPARSQIPQILTDLRGMKDLPPFDAHCSEKGCNSAIRYPLIVKREVSALLCIGSSRTAAFTPDDLSTLEKIASQIGVALENSRLVSDLEALFLATVKTLSSAIDAKSPWTAGHSERVTAYALSIAAEMGLPGPEIKELELGGLLHDIGKIGVSDIILDKPEKLSDEEFEAIKKHTVRGAELIGHIKQLKSILPAIRCHHEYYDGTGYPDGLKGEEIPLAARILAVADTFDAMRADRPYREGRDMDFIIGEFIRCSGTQFDSKIVEVFLRLIEKKGAELISSNGPAAGDKTS